MHLADEPVPKDSNVVDLQQSSPSRLLDVKDRRTFAPAEGRGHRCTTASVSDFGKDAQLWKNSKPACPRLDVGSKLVTSIAQEQRKSGKYPNFLNRFPEDGMTAILFCYRLLGVWKQRLHHNIL
jgi:hypothetical protein